MKTFISLHLIFCALFLSVAAHAADPITEVPSPNPMGETKVDTTDKTLLANKPEGEPCKADYEKFCKDVKPGEGAVLKCMKTHETELSAPCKAKGEWIKAKVRERARDIHEACGAELKQYCSSEKGPRQKLNCLRSHEANLSPECASSLPIGRMKK
jgi:hypothetical protein